MDKVPGLRHKHEEVLQAVGTHTKHMLPTSVTSESAAAAPGTIIGERAFLEFWMSSLIYAPLPVPTAHCVCVGSG